METHDNKPRTIQIGLLDMRILSRKCLGGPPFDRAPQSQHRLPQANCSKHCEILIIVMQLEFWHSREPGDRM
jgi:hypothetical protein